MLYPLVIYITIEPGFVFPPDHVFGRHTRLGVRIKSQQFCPFAAAVQHAVIVFLQHGTDFIRGTTQYTQPIHLLFLLYPVPAWLL